MNRSWRRCLAAGPQLDMKPEISNPKSETNPKSQIEITQTRRRKGARDTNTGLDNSPARPRPHAEQGPGGRVLEAE